MMGKKEARPSQWPSDKICAVLGLGSKESHKIYTYVRTSCAKKSNELKIKSKEQAGDDGFKKLTNYAKSTSAFQFTPAAELLRSDRLTEADVNMIDKALHSMFIDMLVKQRQSWDECCSAAKKMGTYFDPSGG